MMTPGKKSKALSSLRRPGLTGGPIALAAILLLPMAAQAKAGPVATFTPQTNGAYDFGIVDVGTHADQVFKLMNTGGTATAALKISLSGSPAFTKTGDTCAGTSLGPNKKCMITIRYTPTGSGTDTATLTASSTKPSANASVTLNGTAGYVDVAISPASYDFGSTSGTETFTATNNGNISTGTYTFTGPTDEHFAVSGTNGCTGASLAAGGSCSFAIQFSAPGGCGAEPTLYQDSASLGSYATATFKGDQPQCEPHLVVDPYDTQTGDFYGFLFNCGGIVQCVTVSGTQTFTLTNDGTATATNLQLDSELSSTYGYTLEAPSGSGDCQNVSTLAVNGTCTFTVSYTEPDGCDPLTAYDGAVLFFDDAIPSLPNYALTLSFVGLCEG